MVLWEKEGGYQEPWAGFPGASARGSGADVSNKGFLQLQAKPLQSPSLGVYLKREIQLERKNTSH